MPKYSPEHPEIEPLNRVELLVAMAATAVILLLVARVWLLFETFRLPLVFTWQALGLGSALGLGISAVSALVYRLWPTYKKSADVYLDFVLAPLILSDSVWIGLLPGMSEELLFRGVMLPAIGLNAVGLVISSLCFGVLHMSGREQWPYAVWASVVGLVLGGSVLATGNLLVPIVMHVVTNFVSSLSWQLARRSS
ncbi:CPBP family intramembrane glutamic endopeptidase [cf. Phormidesmis sp. LEGE 11477]|uniref:CPBP family intramembrane glutamic endopeptidase n=1 Tax=cf. Phormidesmis sp. LEGE 11477 TaxID=1828680 RepID=UPI00188158E5|nr:CPBP family intramembrane metalloprotease [cf. Phormidesmis sp. LEGE 11477]